MQRHYVVKYNVLSFWFWRRSERNVAAPSCRDGWLQPFIKRHCIKPVQKLQPNVLISISIWIDRFLFRLVTLYFCCCCCCNQQQAHFKTMPVFSREITWKKTPKPNSPHHNAAKIKWQNHKAHNYKKKYVWHCVLNSIWPVLTVYVLRERAGVTFIRKCDWEFRRVLMFENQRK